MSASLATPVVSAPASASPWMWFLAGVMGTAGLGAGGAALYLTQQEKAGTSAPVVAVAPPTAEAPVAPTPLPPSRAVAAPAVKAKQAETHTNIARTAPKKIATAAPVDIADASPAPQRPAALPTQPVWEQAPAPVKPACQHCGTVESVTPIAAEGKPSGAGAVAGAVLGGLLGNQFGGGDGKTLATIGGVLGGAYAGNTVEKRMNQQTSYRVLVRMDDGSSRSVEMSNPSYGVGARVSVQGNVLSPVHSTPSQGA